MTKTRAKTLEMKWFLLTLLRIQFDPYISMSKSELGKLTNQLLTQDEWIKRNNAILFREKSVGLYQQAMARAIAWDTAFRRKCSEARHCKRLTTWNIHCKRGTRVKREGSSTTSIARPSWLKMVYQKSLKNRVSHEFYNIMLEIMKSLTNYS